MSEQQQKDNKKQNKQPKQQKQGKTNTQSQKKNTDAWKQKQAQKKKQKQLKQAQGETDTKEEKKEKKKKEKQEKKDKPKEQQKDKSQGVPVKQKQKMQQGSNKKQANKQQKKQSQKQNIKQQVPSTKVEKKKYRKLDTVQTLVVPKYPLLAQNRQAQIDLLQKQIQTLIRPRDTILYLGNYKLLSTPKLSSGCGKNNYQIVQIPGYTSQTNSQIVCRYQDTSHVISEDVDKVFIQAGVIFQDGSGLVAKGCQNISILANHYNKSVILTCGSWNYCHKSMSGYDQLQRTYGQQLISKWDFIGSECVSLVCLQFGAVLPSQVGHHIEQGYKNYGFATVQW